MPAHLNLIIAADVTVTAVDLGIMSVVLVTLRVLEGVGTQATTIPVYAPTLYGKYFGTLCKLVCFSDYR